MATDPKAAALALHRFGLGPREGTITRIAGDPRGALLAELQKPNAGRVPATDVMNGAATLVTLLEYRDVARGNAPISEMKNAMAMPRTMMMSSDGVATGDMKPSKPAPKTPRTLYLKEAKVRLDTAVGAEIGFVERLVWFWSNHFCVAGDKIGALAGPYEREAIRPFVLGKFADMLNAAESHPAMLFYLDNAFSTGPNSFNGLADGSSAINENLAREIMELHTVGVRSGYTQEDVTNFAKVISGWSFAPAADKKRHGQFAFLENQHEPGAQTIWGKTYPDNGVAQGRAVLADLARKPQTAAHIATKFARYFVADQPPQSLVDKLTKSFIDTDGNLRELAKTLVMAPESWTEERTKIKLPEEWIIAGLRATGTTPEVAGVIHAANVLGQPLWVPAAPNGFSDLSITWVEGLTQRLDIAAEYAERTADKLNPVKLIDTALGPLASNETRQTIGFAGSRQQALTLLLLAPEFQRR